MPSSKKKSKKSISSQRESSHSHSSRCKSAKNRSPQSGSIDEHVGTERKSSSGDTPERLAKEGYELHELLGEGSYSRVYRATNSRTPGVNYACKRYKINSKTKKWVDRCLKREMNLTMLVKHRNIVEAFEAIKTANEAFLVLQFAHNGSIRSYIKKLPSNKYLSESKTQNWMSDIFSAVAYLHNKEIAHRDIKTENFLLDDAMKPLLCDFSFACMSPTADSRFDCMVDTVCGTTSYLAPEVHSLKHGQKYNAKLADVYALGICLYEMLTKHLPFQGHYHLGDPELVKRQMKRDYQYPNKPEVSHDAKCLVDSLLEPNPRSRPTINRVLSNRWLRVIESEVSESSDKMTGPDNTTSMVLFRKQAMAMASSKSNSKSTSATGSKSILDDESSASVSD